MASPPRGQLYLDGNVVHTIVPPARVPHGGRDPIYVVPGQLAVAGVGPGDQDYHGGQWAVYAVTWVADSYLLRSAADVLVALQAGDIEVKRVAEADNRCPIQMTSD